MYIKRVSSTVVGLIIVSGRFARAVDEQCNLGLVAFWEMKRKARCDCFNSFSKHFCFED